MVLVHAKFASLTLGTKKNKKHKMGAAKTTPSPHPSGLCASQAQITREPVLAHQDSFPDRPDLVLSDHPLRAKKQESYTRGRATNHSRPPETSHFFLLIPPSYLFQTIRSPRSSPSSCRSPPPPPGPPSNFPRQRSLPGHHHHRCLQQRRPRPRRRRRRRCRPVLAPPAPRLLLIRLPLEQLVRSGEIRRRRCRCPRPRRRRKGSCSAVPPECAGETLLGRGSA